MIYDHPVTENTAVLNVINGNKEPQPPIRRHEIETAGKSLKIGKSPGINNTPANLIWTGDTRFLMSSSPFAALYGTP